MIDERHSDDGLVRHWGKRQLTSDPFLICRTDRNTIFARACHNPPLPKVKSRLGICGLLPVAKFDPELVAAPRSRNNLHRVALLWNNRNANLLNPMRGEAGVFL